MAIKSFRDRTTEEIANGKKNKRTVKLLPADLHFPAYKKLSLRWHMIRNSIHPGEFLSDILKDRGITQSQLARHIHVEPGVVNLICRGKRGISAGMAKKLARALGTDAELWVNLQSSYDLTQAEDPNFGKLRA